MVPGFCLAFSSVREGTRIEMKTVAHHGCPHTCIPELLLPPGDPSSAPGSGALTAVACSSGSPLNGRWNCQSSSPAAPCHKLIQLKLYPTIPKKNLPMSKKAPKQPTVVPEGNLLLQTMVLTSSEHHDTSWHGVANSILS